MDFTQLYHVVAELNPLLSGARISKIHQPDAGLFVFKLRTGLENIRLLLSCEPGQSRLHLTTQEYLNPHQPPRFCQLLRSRIKRINQLQIVNNDRIVQFDCSGQQGSTRLMLELIGNSSNMILLNDQGVIIDVLKRTDGQDGRRVLLPGTGYVFPQKSNTKNPFADSAVNFAQDGMSWNQHVEKLYTNREATENKQEYSSQLRQTVTKQLKKLSNRMKNISTELEKQIDYEQDKHKAELILAHLHLIKRGMESVLVLNYYQDPPENLAIVLDPLLSPQQNAEKYFKRYKKSRRGIEHSRRRMEETQAELDWLENLDYQLQDTVKNSDIEEIAQELRAAGLLKEQNNLHSRRTQQPSKPHVTTSPAGFRILWGRNNRQNDELSMNLLKAGDLWFHAHHAPGAHLIMKCSESKRAVLEKDIHYAASIAAGYSKGKNDMKVEVMYAEAKSVHKPKGTRPGLVTVKQYKTLIVQPLRIDT